MEDRLLLAVDAAAADVSGSDLNVSELQIPEAVASGEELSIRYTVANESSEAAGVDEWVDVVWLSEDALLDPFDLEIGRISRSEGLAAGESYTQLLVAKTPIVAPGEYRIIVSADSGGVVSDVDGQNNVAASDEVLRVLPQTAATHDPEFSIAVGRTLSAYTTADVADGKVVINYTAYNLTDGYLADVVLATTLTPGVDFAAASQTPDQVGDELTWTLGSIAPYSAASVELTVSLGESMPTQLDSGPRVFAALDGIEVRDVLGPAVLRVDEILPELLAPTVDANSQDPFILSKAAELDQDPRNIFEFVRDQVAYESYVGSLRGSRGALWSAAGNALDQASLMIALLRASGVPAQYASGELTEALSRELIVSMFSAPTRVIGALRPETTPADPAHDPNLLAEASQHAWVLFDDNGAETAADPAFRRAELGEAFTEIESVFAEAPDRLRHRVAITVERELTLPAAGLLTGGASQDRRIVLSETADTVDFVGKPITIGHFVDQTAVGSLFAAATNTYTPYLMVGAGNVFPSDEVLTLGESYQEVITNFPLGSQILTGVFLTIDLIAPGGERTSQTIALADRFGFAQRRTGGSSTLNVALDAAAAISPIDATTLFVTPGDFSPSALARMQAELLTAESDAVDFGKSLSDGSRTLDVAAATDATNLIRDAMIAGARTALANFLVLSDVVAGDFADSLLVRAYAASPRVTVVQSRAAFADDGQVTLGQAIDLLKNDLRVIAQPGQNPEAERVYRYVRGLFDTAFEADALGDPNARANGSTTAVGVDRLVRQALAEGIPFVTLTPEDRLRLQAFGLPLEAELRVSDALDEGKLVLMPDRPLDVNGEQRFAWYEIDATTGDSIGVLDDGTHGDGLLEGVATQLATTFRLSAGSARFVTGYLTGLFTTSVTIGVKDLLRSQIALRIAQGTGLNDVKADAVATVASIIADASAITKSPSLVGTIAFQAGFALGIAPTIVVLSQLRKDPPLDDFLVLAPPSELFPENDGGAVAVQIAPDPLVVLPHNGAQLPTMFRLGITNNQTEADSFALEVVDAPPGFSVQTSVARVTAAPGETAEVGVTFRPTAPLPPLGAEVPYTLRIVSESNPAVSTDLASSFVMPESHGLDVQVNPAAATTAPGLPVTLSVTFIATGNVDEDVTFKLDAPNSLNIQGDLGPVQIPAGQSVTRDFTFAPAADVPLNTTLLADLTANFGADTPVTVTIPLRVAAPGATAAGVAATSLAAAGRVAAARRLEDLAIAITELVQRPDDAVLKSQVLANLEAVADQLAIDDVLRQFVEPLRSQGVDLVASDSVEAIQTSLVELGGVLEELSATVGNLARHDFELFLTPNSQVSAPRVPRTFEVIVQNRGADETTYELAVRGLPNDFVTEFSAAAVTLARGEIASVALTLTQTSDAELTATDFVVEVSAAGVEPVFRKSAIGTLRTRREFVSIPRVDVTPPFADPGDAVNIQATLLNAVNRRQQGRIAYQVLDASGQAVFASDSTPIELTVQSSLATIALPTLDTTNLDLGAYRVAVELTDEAGQTLPGGVGEAPLLIGAPVTADIAVAPDLLPPGSSTVETTLTIDDGLFVDDDATPAASSSRPALELLGQLPIDDPDSENDFNADVVHGVEVNGDLVYVFGDQGLHVVDAANPQAPQHLTTQGGFQYFAGALDADRERLIAVDNGAFGVVGFLSNSVLTTFDLSDRFGSAADPGRIQTIFPNYTFARRPVLSADGSHVFVPTGQLLFRPPPPGQQGEFFAQNGTLLSYDVSNPANMQLVDVLFSDNGANADPPFNQNGGDFFIFDALRVDDDTLYLTSSSAVEGDDGDVATDPSGAPGVGRILIVDVSNPANLALVGDADPAANGLAIPGTAQVHGIAVDGDVAFVVGSGAWKEPFDVVEDIGPVGNLVLAAVDISDPRDPQLIHSQTLERAARGGGYYVVSLGQGRFAFDSLGGLSDAPLLYVVDASDPRDMQVVQQLEVPGVIEGLAVDDGRLYASGADGLTIYRIDSLGAIQVTAQVQTPNGSGVAVVDGSFNIEPTRVVAGTDFDTLIWELTLDGESPPQVLSWQSTVAGLQPGETRNVTLDAIVDYISQGAPGSLTLPPQAVFAEQVLSLAPAERTVRPGEAANYTLTIVNPSSLDAAYDLEIRGVAQEWVDVAAQVTVPAGTSLDFPITLASGATASLGQYGFVVVATADGVSGSVEGSLVLAGEPILPRVDPESHGVVVAISPERARAGQGGAARFVVRVANTGSATDTFELTAALPPTDFDVSFERNVVEVPPGANNFRDVPLTIVPAVGVEPAEYLFQVAARSQNLSEVNDAAAGLLTVVSSGVNVQLTPPLGEPGGAFQLAVLNTGSQTDTFRLSLAAPAALAATLETDSVTLAPGESTNVPIEVGSIEYAFPGALDLVGTAVSTMDADVLDADAAQVTIAERRAVTARFDPETVELGAPGRTTLLLLVDNVGNLGEELSATIVDVTGPLTASLRDLNGQPATTLPLFRLPGLSQAALLVDAELSDFDVGAVTVLVRSLLAPEVAAPATARVFSTAPVDVEFDFGDAPPQYGTLLADNGARHAAIGPLLGQERDAEADAALQASGGGDDRLNTGSVDDEDGVTIADNFTLLTGQAATATVRIQGVGAVPARVFAWVDFNGDGRFGDDEQIADGSEPLGDGEHKITFLTRDLGFGGGTYARFRVTTQTELGPLGPAVDGEVEDYPIRIVRPVVAEGSISGFSYVDANNNGLFDAAELPLLGTRIVLEDATGRILDETFSDGQGFFRFDELPEGRFTIRKIQPPMFIDGRDTPGTLGDADEIENQFTIKLPASIEATEYLFAERGLLPWFVGKHLFLASTPEQRTGRHDLRPTGDSDNDSDDVLS